MTAPPIDLRRHRGPTLAVAGAVVAVVVAAVLLFGVVPYPELPTLEAAPVPELDADLAVLRYGDDGPCLSVVDPAGVERELACGPAVEGFGLRWLDDGRIALEGGRAPDAVTVVDPTTGEVVRRTGDGLLPMPDDRSDRFGQLAPDPPGSPPGVSILDEERSLVVLDGPPSYDLVQPRWTADGRAVVVGDTIGRVLVVPADGGDARVWAEDVGEWAIP